MPTVIVTQKYRERIVVSAAAVMDECEELYKRTNSLNLTAVKVS